MEILAIKPWDARPNRIWRGVRVLILTGACMSAAYAGVEAIISMHPPESSAGLVEIPVVLYGDPEDGLSGLQFDLHYDPAQYQLVDVASGAAATDPGKVVTHSEGSPGDARVLIIGFNNEEMYDGHVATVTLRPLGAGSSADGMSLDNILATDPMGNTLPISYENLYDFPPTSDPGEEVLEAQDSDDPQELASQELREETLEASLVEEAGEADAGVLESAGQALKPSENPARTEAQALASPGDGSSNASGSTGRGTLAVPPGEGGAPPLVNAPQGLPTGVARPAAEESAACDTNGSRSGSGAAAGMEDMPGGSGESGRRPGDELPISESMSSSASPQGSTRALVLASAIPFQGGALDGVAGAGAPQTHVDIWKRPLHHPTLLSLALGTLLLLLVSVVRRFLFARGLGRGRRQPR